MKSRLLEVLSLFGRIELSGTNSGTPLIVEVEWTEVSGAVFVVTSSKLDPAWIEGEGEPNEYRRVCRSEEELLTAIDLWGTRYMI